MSCHTDESAVPAAKRQRLQMPDEYLPPNSVLFIQNLPEGTTSDDLREVFEMCVSRSDPLQSLFLRTFSYTLLPCPVRYVLSWIVSLCADANAARSFLRSHAGLLEIRTIPAKKDIAFVEFSDEGAATTAKDALHNFKIDGETKMKVRPAVLFAVPLTMIAAVGDICEKVIVYDGKSQKSHPEPCVHTMHASQIRTFVKIHIHKSNLAD